MSIVRKLLPVPLLVLVVCLTAGCGIVGSLSGSGKNFTIGYIQWDENVAVSNLTKILLEEDLGYENVELELTDVPGAFDKVASDDLDAFQNVWTPNHEKFINKVGKDVQRLEPWYEGETSYGIAVPDYMTNVRSLGDLNHASTPTRSSA